MKKILKIASLIGLMLPSIALAAFNDVTLTTDTVFTVDGMTLNVTGSSATIESIVVDGSRLTVTIAAGSSITVDAANHNILSDALESGVTYTKTSTCTNSDSNITLTGGSGTSVVSITPSVTSCGGGGSGGGGGGGGGGGSSTPTPTPATTTPAQPTAPATPAAPSANIAALVAQLQSLIATLKSMGGTVSPALEATIASLAGTAPKSPGAFMRDLSLGMTGDDVKALQVFLNTHGYPVTASGSGSRGNETNRFGGLTRAALAKFQKDKGITPPAGHFGPKTRAAVNGMK
ncbi:MAG: peptidoglycan-binding domain-containing protein [Patescibacteria group bacterium]